MHQLASPLLLSNNSTVIAYLGLFFTAIFVTLDTIASQFFHITQCMEFTQLSGISAFQGLRFLVGKSFSCLFSVYAVVYILCTLLLLI